jgi:hypothetical protein
MRGMRYVPHMKTHATSVEVGEIGPTAEVVEHGGPPVVDGEEDQPRRGVCQVREVTRRSIASRDRGIEAQDFPSSQLRPTETLQALAQWALDESVAREEARLHVRIPSRR